MNLRRPLVWLILVATVLAVEGSILLRHSLLRPRSGETCLTCRAGDRPLVYPLISYFGKIKDVFVRLFKGVVASAKELERKIS